MLGLALVPRSPRMALWIYRFCANVAFYAVDFPVPPHGVEQKTFERNGCARLLVLLSWLLLLWLLWLWLLLWLLLLWLLMKQKTQYVDIDIPTALDIPTATAIPYNYPVAKIRKKASLLRIFSRHPTCANVMRPRTSRLRWMQP